MRKCKDQVTCVCGNKIYLRVAYKCLYCGIWFCRSCAKRHFGTNEEKTVSNFPIKIVITEEKSTNYGKELVIHCPDELPNNTAFKVLETKLQHKGDTHGNI